VKGVCRDFTNPTLFSFFNLIVMWCVPAVTANKLHRARTDWVVSDKHREVVLVVSVPVKSHRYLKFLP
jgi:hypothetical protein